MTLSRVSGDVRWTCLPPAPLKGVGTSMVESLDHYAARIAHASGITMTRLIGVLSPWRPGMFRAKSYVAGFGRSRIEGFVAGLSRLTGRSDLHCGTFYVVSEVLQNYGVGLSAKHRRWCPQCFEEWDPTSSYEPLIWRLPDLDICTIHRCALRDRCFVCERKQPLPASYSKRRICASCSSPLSARQLEALASRTPYENHVERCATDLLGLCADANQGVIDYSEVRPFFGEACQALLRTGLACDVPDLDRLFVCLRSGRMTTRHLFQLCAVQGVGPKDILLRPREAASGQLVGRFVPELDQPGLPPSVTPRLRVAHCWIRSLHRERRIGMFLPSVTRVLHAAGVGRNQFIDADRILYHDYRLAYLAQGSSQSLRDAERCLSSSLRRVRGTRYGAEDVPWFFRCAKSVADECGMSTIVTRKCVRAAMWIRDLEASARRQCR